MEVLELVVLELVVLELVVLELVELVPGTCTDRVLSTVYASQFVTIKNV